MIKLVDLGMAYRKAKVDLYYTSTVSFEAIADYEENLHANLSALQKKLNGKDESWVTKLEFLGGWTLVPKSINLSDWKKLKDEKGGIGFIHSSPTDEWAQICAQLKHEDDRRPKAEFRVMAKCSLDFHVLSTLWMIEVGSLFDAELTECAYGNRLRRKESGDKGINKFSLGTFQPYLKPFRDWRDNGIKAMRSALDADKKIIALTADVQSFYHELNPDFMLDPNFINLVLERPLNPEQEKLHRLFISALKAWAQITPLKKGLPVGLPASAVVANMALIKLDQVIECEVSPLYYGRYVDDILLVMENRCDFKTTKDLWDWLFARSKGLLGWTSDGGGGVVFQPPYLQEGDAKSTIQFVNDKNKIFLLSGASGKTLVDSIDRQIHERASEWRAMPRLPHSADHVASDLLAATQRDGETADNLRKTDTMSMTRASFAIKLRDFEAYERDLEPHAWQPHRRAFLNAFTEHVLTLPHFFDLAQYLPRVIRLATACEDFADLKKMLEALDTLVDRIKDDCELIIKADHKKATDDKEIISRWKQQLSTTVVEGIMAAFPPKLSKQGHSSWKENMDDYSPSSVEAYLSWPFSDRDFQKKQARLFSFDLAHQPFRFIGLLKEMVAQRGIPYKKTVVYCDNPEQLLEEEVIIGSELIATWMKLNLGFPSGLLFATRPFNLIELFILNKDAFKSEQQKAMKSAVFAMRGFSLNDQSPRFDTKGALQIPDGYESGKYAIAVSSWETKVDSWNAAVTRKDDPDTERYERLCSLINGIISNPKESRYLVLPELSMPAHWFIRTARKLQGRGISLIAGIEYLHNTKSRVHNQVWAALTHDGLGFPSLMVYRQDKQRPALGEAQELKKLAGLEMKPIKSWNTPPIIQHGNLRFSILICSELTNIRYRSDLRGKIDALFVPEWNKDTETFNALVESAALDIHAYIIQCNDRQYGDSRIRAPFKNNWERDILRVKGGVTDYCVIGEIDVTALRQFQSFHESPDKPFKPVPDGFSNVMDYSRKVLPKSKSE